MLSAIADLAYDDKLVTMAQSYGIDIMDVAWEDCARTKGSCFGPSISDMTLNVDGTNMPLMRRPNFADVTSDQDINKFNVVVGNESGHPKTQITFKEYLESVAKYTGNSKLKSMYLPRDEKILTSTQACILPLSDGEVKFNVKLYNYQSYDEPAVLILICSSEGTSAQIVKGHECTLYFNKVGQNANYIAERLSDDRKRRGVSVEGEMTNVEKQRNALLIFQIPLVQKEPFKRQYQYGNVMLCSANIDQICMDQICMDQSCMESCSTSTYASLSRRSGTAVKARGLENAVIKTSEGFGKFIGTEDRELVRDYKNPIRCTIQYYKVTDRTEISEQMIKEIAGQINEEYNSVSDSERGSLVLDNSERKTESSNKCSIM